MPTGLLPNLESRKPPGESLPAPEPSAMQLEQPSYLSRIATLPAPPEGPPPRSADRIDQIEHALTILASVVARLAKEAQQSKLQIRPSDHESNTQEERRVQRELVRSMQARLILIEERMERQHVESAPQPAVGMRSDEAEKVAASLASIGNALASLAKRRETPRRGRE